MKIIVEIDDETPMIKVNEIIDSIDAMTRVLKVKTKDIYFETDGE